MAPPWNGSLEGTPLLGGVVPAEPLAAVGLPDDVGVAGRVPLRLVAGAGLLGRGLRGRGGLVAGRRPGWGGGGPAGGGGAGGGGGGLVAPGVGRGGGLAGGGGAEGGGGGLVVPRTGRGRPGGPAGAGGAERSGGGCVARGR